MDLSPIEESAAEEEIAANLEHDECDIKLVENSYFIISSEFPKKKNVYLDQEEYTEETALLKREYQNLNTGQRTKWPEER